MPKADQNVTFLYRQDRALHRWSKSLRFGEALGFDIDYKRLLKEFQSRGTLLKAFYYTAIIEDQEYSSIRPLIDWLDHNGYTVVTKATKLRRSEAVYEADVQRHRTVHPHRAATLRTHPASTPARRAGLP
ncbi:uncharacterized LabA/DUF88 family protein [Bradyrhizobium sp. F1.13.1]